MHYEKGDRESELSVQRSVVLGKGDLKVELY